MKKRTFGRIAAVGLAGLTAIPAISIVASADVTITANKNKEGHTIITGSAWKVHWSIRQTTHNYTVNPNGTLSDSPTFMTARDPGGNALSVGNYSLEDTQYWMYKDNGASIPDSVKATVDSYNALFNNYKADLEEYAWYASCQPGGTNYMNAETSKTIDGVQYFYGKYTAEGVHDVATGTWGFVTANPAAPGTYVTAQLSLSKPNYTYIEYAFIDNASNSSISLSSLASEIGTSYVTLNGNRIVASSSGVAGSYVISGSSSGTSTNTGNTSYGTYDLPAGYLYSDSKSYSVDGVTWYPNLAALRAVWGSGVPVSTHIPNPAYSSTYCCFNPVDGNYYTIAQVNTGSLPYARQVSYGATTSNTEYAVYRVDNGYYYHTWSSAYAAAGNDASRITLVRNYTSAGNYFSRVTGSFYNYYEDALYASRNNSSLVVTVNGSSYGSYYDDPYYYYFLYGNSGSSSSSSLGGSSVKIGNRSGWSNVRSSIRSAKSGASLSVTMNGETSIPEEILTALDGKNVDVNFKLKNGAVVTINGQDISTPKDINVAVTYNTKNVPSGLVKKATSVNNSLSTSQISVSSNTFGGKIGVTVKYSANRAGCTAKIYRYNSSRNSLQLVDTSTVSSSGKVAFDGMAQGGDFVIVLFKN